MHLTDSTGSTDLTERAPRTKRARRRTGLAVLPVAAAALVLSLAGCSAAASNDPASNDPASNGPAAADPAATAEQGTTHVITIDGLKFTPAELTIKPGDTVVWNMESHGMPHDVVSDDGVFQSELMTGGEFKHTFTDAGTFSYHCTPHPPMTGTITVAE